jgi:plastocyanin
MSWLRFSILFAILSLSLMAPAQSRVTGRVEIKHPAHVKGEKDNRDVVVALVPTNNVAIRPPTKHYRLGQKDKSFEKHLLAISAGSFVDFPNFDPIFHNVFSLFEGQRFDLGLYETGSSRSVKFAKSGVSYIFCNIHPEMEAIVVTLPTTSYAVTAKDGAFSIDNVPTGRYELHIWYERASADQLSRLDRTIDVKSDTTLSPIMIQEMPQVTAPHKNKYGRDYDVTGADSPYLPGQ